MTRIKRGFVARRRRKKLYNLTKGFVGSHSKLFATSNQQNMKALRYSYFDRRKKKNEFKKLWIQRINGSAHLCSKKYNRIIRELKESKILINKKMISKIGIFDFESFKKLTTKIELKKL